MDINIIPLYPKTHINKIFPDIIFDHINYNAETNLMPDDFIVNDNLEPFDKFFNDKRSRNSSYDDENDFQKIISYKPNIDKLNSPKKINSSQDINSNKKEKIILNINGNNNNNGNININKINDFENNKDTDKKKDKEKKKIIFNSFNPNTIKEIQIQQQNQRIKNKLSARKCRLKKKLYVEKLEKEYVLVKKELDEIKQKLGINNNNGNLSLSDVDNLKNNKNICENCLNIEGIKVEENLIISENNNDIINKNNLINTYTVKQRIILEQLLVKQIQVMMPIKVKMFQNKYLKLLSINIDDNINVVKNKIDENLHAIQDLYDIDNYKKEEEDNGGVKVKRYQMEYKSKSMAHQLYNFYINLKNYVNEFEKIYFSLLE